MELLGEAWRALCLVAEGAIGWAAWVARAIADWTGLPLLVGAALAIVVSFRIARRAWRLVVQVSVVMLALVVATELHWLSW